MSLLAVLKLPPRPSVQPQAVPEEGVVGRDAAAFERAKKLRDGMKDQLEKGWREAIEIAKKLDPGVKEGFVLQLQAVDKQRREASSLDGDPPGQVVRLAGALMGLKQARQAVGKPVHDGTDADTAYKSDDGTEVGKPKNTPAAPPPIVAKSEVGEEEAAGTSGEAGNGAPTLPGIANHTKSAKVAPRKDNIRARRTKPAPSGTKAASSNATLVIDSFPFGKPEVPGSGVGPLQNLRQRLAAAPGSTLRLVGHTDTVGTERNNQELGVQRAKAVRALLLVDKGVNAGHIQLESAGEKQPAAGEGPAKLDPAKGEKNARNRRVEVFVTWAKSASDTVTDVQDPGGQPQPPSDEAAEKTGVRKGLTFEHQWESKDFAKWKVSYATGGIKIKAKFKGELVQKGSGTKVTEGLTSNIGVKGLVELGKQKAVEIFSGLTLKEVTETFEHELSLAKAEIKFQIKATLQTAVPWLSPVVTGSFTIFAADWKKLKNGEGGLTAATFAIAAGVQGKGKIDINESWEANLSVEFTVEGFAKPDWTAIALKAAQMLATRAAQTAAAEGVAEKGAEGAVSVLSFEVLITAGAVALGASVIAGTLKTMVDVEEIKGLPKLVDKTANLFRRGYAAGILDEKEPSDPLEKAGFGIGQKNFEEAKQAALSKAQLTDKEIRSAIREQVREKWKLLLFIFRPYAQQAVWDAFGSAHVGWVNRNIDPTTVKWGYQAIYGELPSESDANYMKYYLK